MSRLHYYSRAKLKRSSIAFTSRSLLADQLLINDILSVDLILKGELLTECLVDLETYFKLEAIAAVLDPYLFAAYRSSLSLTERPIHSLPLLPFTLRQPRGCFLWFPRALALPGEPWSSDRADTLPFIYSRIRSRSAISGPAKFSANPSPYCAATFSLSLGAVSFTDSLKEHILFSSKKTFSNKFYALYNRLYPRLWFELFETSTNLFVSFAESCNFRQWLQDPDYFNFSINPLIFFGKLPILIKKRNRQILNLLATDYTYSEALRFRRAQFSHGLSLLWYYLEEYSSSYPPFFSLSFTVDEPFDEVYRMKDDPSTTYTPPSPPPWKIKHPPKFLRRRRKPRLRFQYSPFACFFYPFASVPSPVLSNSFRHFPPLSPLPYYQSLLSLLLLVFLSDWRDYHSRSARLFMKENIPGLDSSHQTYLAHLITSHLIFALRSEAFLKGLLDSSVFQDSEGDSVLDPEYPTDRELESELPFSEFDSDPHPFPPFNWLLPTAVAYCDFFHINFPLLFPNSPVAWRKEVRSIARSLYSKLIFIGSDLIARASDRANLGLFCYIRSSLLSEIFFTSVDKRDFLRFYNYNNLRRPLFLFVYQAFCIFRACYSFVAKSMQSYYCINRFPLFFYLLSFLKKHISIFYLPLNLWSQRLLLPLPGIFDALPSRLLFSFYFRFIFLCRSLIVFFRLIYPAFSFSLYASVPRIVLFSAVLIFLCCSPVFLPLFFLLLNSIALLPISLLLLLLVLFFIRSLFLVLSPRGRRRVSGGHFFTRVNNLFPGQFYAYLTAPFFFSFDLYYVLGFLRFLCFRFFCGALFLVVRLYILLHPLFISPYRFLLALRRFIPTSTAHPSSLPDVNVANHPLLFLDFAFPSVFYFFGRFFPTSSRFVFTIFDRYKFILHSFDSLALLWWVRLFYMLQLSGQIGWWLRFDPTIHRSVPSFWASIFATNHLLKYASHKADFLSSGSLFFSIFNKFIEISLLHLNFHWGVFNFLISFLHPTFSLFFRKRVSAFMSDILADAYLTGSLNKSYVVRYDSTSAQAFDLRRRLLKPKLGPILVFFLRSLLFVCIVCLPPMLLLFSVLAFICDSFYRLAPFFFSMLRVLFVPLSTLFFLVLLASTFCMPIIYCWGFLALFLLRPALFFHMHLWYKKILNLHIAPFILTTILPFALFSFLLVLVLKLLWLSFIYLGLVKFALFFALLRILSYILYTYLYR